MFVECSRIKVYWMILLIGYVRPKTYKLITSAVSWDNARAICINDGMDLVVINDNDVMTEVREYISTVNGFSADMWIGLTWSGVPSHFFWVNNKKLSWPFGEPPWYSGEPNCHIVPCNLEPTTQNCVRMSNDLLEWKTHACDQQHYPICQSLSSTTREVPTTTESVTTDWPTTVKSTTTDSPTTTESVTTNWPTTVKSTTTDSPTTTESVTTDWPTTVKSTTTDSPTTTESVTTNWSSTVKSTTTNSQATTESVTTDWSTSIKSTTTDSPTTTESVTTDLSSTVKTSTTSSPTTTQSTLKETSPESNKTQSQTQQTTESATTNLSTNPKPKSTIKSTELPLNVTKEFITLNMESSFKTGTEYTTNGTFFNNSTQICTCKSLSNGKNSPKENYKIDRRTTSAYIRRHSSAYDGRLSSRIMGYTGAAVICAVVLIVVSFDIINLMKRNAATKYS